MRTLRGVTSRGLIVTLTVLVLYSIAFNQSRTGILVGRIYDPQNKGLEGVQVKLGRVTSWSRVSHKVISNRQAPVTTQLNSTLTDTTGLFQFTGLSPGFYSLEVSLAGWQNRSVTNLEVRAASTLDIKIQLLPAARNVDQQLQSIGALDRGVWLGRRFGQFSLHALPTTRRIWSILENQETSTVTDRLDIGGLDTGRSVLFGAFGASWTENRYKLNGFDVQDAYLAGRAVTDPDFESLADIGVIAASKPALFSGPGVEVDLTTRPTPSDGTKSRLKGTIKAFFSSGALQSDNINARLDQLGFPGPERLNHLVDVTGQISGELLPSQSKLPFFLSLSTQQLSKTLGGFAAPIHAHVYHALADITLFSHGNKRLDLLYAGQHVFNSHQNADHPRVAPSASERRNDNFHQLQARWFSFPSDSSQWEIGFGVDHATVSSGIQPGTVETSTVDLPEVIRTGAAPLSFAGAQTRYQANAGLQSVHYGLFGSHSFSIGGTFDRSNITNSWDSLGGIEQILIEGAGAEVVRWNTPTEARQHVQNLALFGQDQWRPAEWLAVPLGLRFENSSGQAGDVSNRVNWTTIEPRLGFVIPLPVGFVFRASFARYGHVLQGRYLDFGNPGALAGQVLQWQDVNGDRRAQSFELGQILRVFGGPFSAVDANLRRPHTDEVALVLEKRIGEKFVARANFFHRDTRHLIEIVNTGVPLSSYTPTIVVDPGNDGLIGTADDQRLTLFNRLPPDLGKDFFLLTNPPGYHASYKGFEIEAIKRFGRHWESTLSFTAMHSSAPTNPGNQVFQNDPGFIIFDMSVFAALNADPNTLLFATGRSFFDRGFTGKLTGYYEGPYGLQFGAVAKYYDGLPFGRMLFVNGFNQGPFFVRATPRADFGAFRTQFNSTLDLAVARAFSIKHGEISLHVDVFNLLNLNKDTVQADLTSPTFAQRVPLSIQAPRTVRLGIEWNF